MPTASGLIYQNGEFVEKHIEYDDDGIVDIVEGLRKDALYHGIIIPKFVNCHTHLGDSALPKPESGTVEEIVAPPDGYKHRMLRLTSDEELESAMHEKLIAMAKAGISTTIDFREGGLKGISVLLSASLGTGISPIVFGRPSGPEYEPQEMKKILAVADGIGLSSISDYDSECVRRVADDAGAAETPIALHASEQKREDIDKILGLNPAFLVHMIKAGSDDLAACREADVPIIICPSANAFFGLRPPVESMIENEVDICLGTDNAMLAEPDMFAEMKFLRNMADAETLPDSLILKIVFDNSRKVLNSVLGCGDERWGNDGFVVLDKSKNNPFAQVLDSSKSDICFTWNGRM